LERQLHTMECKQDMEEKTVEIVKKGLSAKMFRKVGILAILLIAIIVAGYFYFQYRNAQKILQNPTLAATQEAKSLVAKVAVLIELPKDEDPTIATVSDKSKLADQPFFANAQNGDKVLIYSRAKEAILYRPSLNKLIVVAPVSDAFPQTTTTHSGPVPTTTVTAVPTLTPVPAEAVATAKVVIYNGTKIVGLAGTYEKQLKSKFANIEVVKIGNSIGDYTASVVVDLSGKNGDLVKQIASSIDGTVGTLPTTETKPDADILVIVGK
jgi:hypothetical protein